MVYEVTPRSRAMGVPCGLYFRNEYYVLEYTRIHGPPQVIVWVAVGELVFLHIHTCSIFKFSRRPGVYKILVMAVHRARARAANAPTAKFPSFFRFSTSQKGAFHQIVKKSLNLPYKKVIFF